MYISDVDDFYIELFSWLFLMGGKVLSDIVESGSFNNQVFLSSSPISGKGGPVHYMIDIIDVDVLYVFPMDSNGGKLFVRKKSIGLPYSEHKNDVLEEANFLEYAYVTDYGYLNKMYLNRGGKEGEFEQLRP